LGKIKLKSAKISFFIKFSPRFTFAKTNERGDKDVNMKIDLKKLDELSGWDEIRFPPPDFLTHLHYVECLNTLSQKLILKDNLNIRNQIEESSHLSKKLNLIKLTLKNIKGEYNTILKHPDFAELCVSWISVKSYYLIFNLLLILDYLITGQESSFNLSHEKAINRFKKYLDDNLLFFNKEIFNKNFSCSRIMKVKVRPGANVKIMNFTLKERTIQILQKLVRYKLQEFKRREGIKNFRAKKNRKKRDCFLQTNTVNLFEFFYWYRIKANYRDLEFLDKNISSKQFKNFYKSYFGLTINFINAFVPVINKLARVRVKRNLFRYVKAAH